MAKTKIALLYERLSRDAELSGESFSIQNQKIMLEDFARRNGYLRFKHFTDDGVSGTRFDRPGFMAMMEEVEDGGVEAIIVKDMSRLGRDYLKVGQVMEILRQRGVRLIAINDNVDTDKGDNDMTPFLNIMYEFYARDTSRKIKSVFKAKGMSGKHLTGFVPYGYLWDEKRENWIVDGEAADVVRRIYAMTLEGYGPFQIASRLTADKIEMPAVHMVRHGEGLHKTRDIKDPCQWSTSTIVNILKRREYLGHTINFKTRKHFKDKKSHYVDESEWTIFRNVVKAIDTRQLHTVFIEWMKDAVESINSVVAADGKQARRTKDAKKRALHVVSAFSTECGLVLGQLACEEKSNEITTIPRLLEHLELKGGIVTIDAMGTQSEIAAAITNKGADYILSLKENQPGLYRDVKLYFQEYRRNTAGSPAACCARSHSQGHGRFESRSCYICEDISWLEGREKWSNLQGIGVIFSETEENGKKSKQAHYFIYSRKGMTAAQILEAKRRHWGIENKLHWVLDMQFREDESRARADNSAENLNVLRHWAYNLLKAQSSLKGSFSDKQFKCLLDETFLDKVIASALCS